MVRAKDADWILEKTVKIYAHKTKCIKNGGILKEHDFI